MINGGNTTKYFKLKKYTRQGDQIFAYLFILVPETFFFCLLSKIKYKRP